MRTVLYIRFTERRSVEMIWKKLIEKSALSKTMERTAINLRIPLYFNRVHMFTIYRCRIYLEMPLRQSP